LKIKEELTKERDDQLVEIVKLREAMANAQQQQAQLEQAKEEANLKISEVSLS
jgi:hypothetical protein